MTNNQESGSPFDTAKTVAQKFQSRHGGTARVVVLSFNKSADGSVAPLMTVVKGAERVENAELRTLTLANILQQDLLGRYGVFANTKSEGNATYSFIFDEIASQKVWRASCPEFEGQDPKSRFPSVMQKALIRRIALINGGNRKYALCCKRGQENPQTLIDPFEPQV